MNLNISRLQGLRGWGFFQLVLYLWERSYTYKYLGIGIRSFIFSTSDIDGYKVPFGNTPRNFLMCFASLGTHLGIH
jgi:hypothetical protein